MKQFPDQVGGSDNPQNHADMTIIWDRNNVGELNTREVYISY
jgi:hypothetical protein